MRINKTVKKTGRYKHADYSIIYQATVINARTANGIRIVERHISRSKPAFSDCLWPFRLILKRWVGSIRCFTGGKETGIN